MLKPNLLSDIAFDEEMQENYRKYTALVGDEIEAFAHRYMSLGADFKQTVAEMHDALAGKGVHEYTQDLLFVLSCTGYLYARYQAQGIDDVIFTDSMRDIKYKTDECRKCKGVFGIFVIGWYPTFFEMRNFALGRLQFEIAKSAVPCEVREGYVVRETDFCVYCHIPSGSPLLKEDVLRSYQAAYAFFRDRIDTETGVLPVYCNSWFFYPRYRDAFREGSKNIYRFISDYTVVKEVQTESFGDAWRVFGAPYSGNVSDLPCQTRLQRAFAEYIRGGGTFGVGIAVLLFDGEKILL